MVGGVGRRGHLLAQRAQLFGRDERLHRVGQRVVPVLVEAGRHLRHHRANGQDVHVDEVAAVGGAEVGVAQVAPAGDAPGVVGDVQLVVHAVLHAPEVVQRAHGAHHGGAAPARQRVVHAHLHAGQKSHAHHQRVLAGGVEVIQQDAHAHAALGGQAHFLQQARGALVAVDGVVLDVQRAAGLLRQRQAAAEGEVGGIDQRVAGQVGRRVGRPARRRQLAQRRAGGAGQRVRYRALDVLGQAAAARQHDRQQQQRQPRQPAGRGVWAREWGRLEHGGGRVIDTHRRAKERAPPVGQGRLRAGRRQGSVVCGHKKAALRRLFGGDGRIRRPSGRPRWRRRRWPSPTRCRHRGPIRCCTSRCCR